MMACGPTIGRNRVDKPGIALEDAEDLRLKASSAPVADMMKDHDARRHAGRPRIQNTIFRSLARSSRLIFNLNLI
jgi:hypothetical protein